MAKKCPECRSCLDMIWILPRRYFHCWLCRDWYDVIDNKVVKLDKDSIPVPKEIIEQVENQGNAQFK